MALLQCGPLLDATLPMGAGNWSSSRCLVDFKDYGEGRVGVTLDGFEVLESRSDCLSFF